MTFNFNVPIKTVKGTETNQKLSDLLAEFISTETKGNVRKLSDWARSLALGEALTLDRADKKVFSDLVENSDRLVILAKGQVLDILDAQEAS